MPSAVIEYRPEALADMESAMLSALRDGVPRVILNLDAVDALDNNGVRGLIRLLRSSRAAGGALALMTSKEMVRRTLSVTALDRLFEMAEAAA
jgi:anti-anti-sigma factor